MMSIMKYNYLFFFTLILFLSQTYSSLKFKKENNFIAVQNLPDSIKQKDIENLKKQVDMFSLNESVTKDLVLFTPVISPFDALVVNFRGKNRSNKSIYTHRKLPINSSILSEEIESNNKIFESFIEDEDHISLIEYEHLTSDQKFDSKNKNTYDSYDIESVHLNMN